MMRGMDMAEVIRRRRAELGLSQADLAKAAGVDTRQIRRYEAGQQQPVLSVAVAIAKALGISVSELAGAPSHRVSLTGDWWTCWQTSRGGVEDVRTQPVHLDQHGELIQIEPPLAGGQWRKAAICGAASCVCGDNEILLGWCAANDGSVRSKGTMYFVLHPHGIHATGRWVGLSYDGNIVAGWSSMARTEDPEPNPNFGPHMVHARPEPIGVQRQPGRIVPPGQQVFRWTPAHVESADTDEVSSPACDRSCRARLIRSFGAHDPGRRPG